MEEAKAPLKLHLNEVVCGYPGFSVNHVNIELTQGNILGLLGRSGSGKSTILKAILGLIKPHAGTIELRQAENHLSIPDRVGYSPQKGALFPFLSIEENIQTFGSLFKIPRLKLKERMDKLLERLELTEHRGKRVRQLSGGMSKRVDLACTLIHDPDFVILDEPFNGLDVSLQGFIWKLLRELSKEGKIIIVTSHLLQDLQKECTRFGLVEEGTYYGNTQLLNAVRKQSGTLQDFLEDIFKRRIQIQ